MNFEHLIKKLSLEKNKLKRAKAVKRFIIYFFQCLKIKKNKLKLGDVAFDVIQTFFAGFQINEQLSMRYIRQDTIDEDALKVENRLEALKWKWDYANILALLIVVSFFFILLLAFLYVWYCNNLPTFAYKNPKYNLIVERSIKVLFSPNSTWSISLINWCNFFLVDTLVNLCIFFNVLF